MTIEQILHERSESKCELCSASEDLVVYEVPPESQGNIDDSILICNTCREQIENRKKQRLIIGGVLTTVCGVKHPLYR